MTPPVRALPALLALLSTLAAGADADAQARPAHVIPPGQDALVGQLLGLGETLGGACALREVSIESARVVAGYDCGAQGRAQVELRHPEAPGPEGVAQPVARTERFALWPRTVPLPSALADALPARLRAREGPFQWAAPPPERSDDSPADAAAPPLTQDQQARYAEGLRLYDAHRYPEAFVLYRALAAENPHHGVLGMVVATLAPQVDVPAAARFAAEADAHPGDPLAQFLAGVASHYAGHHHARSLEQKRELYEQALRYLARARPAYDFEPRMFIYLAVSHFRLGHVDEARTLIEHAVEIGPQDPDVFYCRAEIFQGTNLERSLQDLDRYIDMVSAVERAGHAANPDKSAMVRRMRDHLRAVARGEASRTELFDPLAGTPITDLQSGQSRRVTSTPGRVALGVGGAALLAGVAATIARRRRHGRAGAG